MPNEDTTNEAASPLRTKLAAGANEDRETISVGEAAKRLGLSLPQVRRRLEWGDLEGERRSPSLEPRRDAKGNLLRGHRRVFVDSVVRYERLLREASESDTRNP